MVEGGQRTGTRRLAQGDSGLPGRMAPTAVVEIFVLGVGGVVDHEVRSGDERDERVRWSCGIVLDVADVAEAASAVIEAVSGRAARMHERAGPNLDAIGEPQGLAGL